MIPKISQAYYTFLSAFVSSTHFSGFDQGLVLTAIRIPLVEHIERDNNGELQLSRTPAMLVTNPLLDNLVLNAHAAFSLYFLTTPRLAKYLGGLDGLAAVINVGLLSSALVREFSSTSVEQIQDERKLWLLAHFISLHRLQNRSSQEPEFLRALSLQLSRSSSDIISRIDAQDPELNESSEGGESDGNISPPLPTFVKEELL